MHDPSCPSGAVGPGATSITRESLKWLLASIAVLSILALGGMRYAGGRAAAAAQHMQRLRAVHATEADIAQVRGVLAGMHSGMRAGGRAGGQAGRQAGSVALFCLLLHVSGMQPTAHTSGSHPLTPPLSAGQGLLSGADEEEGRLPGAGAALPPAPPLDAPSPTATGGSSGRFTSAAAGGAGAEGGSARAGAARGAAGISGAPGGAAVLRVGCLRSAAATGAVAAPFTPVAQAINTFNVPSPAPPAPQAYSTAGSAESFWASLTEPLQPAPHTPAGSNGPSSCAFPELFADLNPLLHSKKGR